MPARTAKARGATTARIDGQPVSVMGFTVTTTSGQAMTFARGPVWVVLAAAP